MNQKTDTALEEALRAAAPDGGSWLAGRAAFFESIASDSDDTEKAYKAALNAAAPDGGSWIAGRNVLVLRGKLTLTTEDKPTFMERLTSRNIGLPKRSPVSSRDWTTPRKIIAGVILGFIAWLVVALIVAIWIQILSPYLLLILCIMMVGGGALGYHATKPKVLVYPAP